jgi:hypothetical protein
VREPETKNWLKVASERGVKERKERKEASIDD